MFWNPKLSVTDEDKVWTERSLLWLTSEFGKQFLKSLKTIVPDEAFFKYRFTNNEQDAVFVLNHVCEQMGVNKHSIDLYFFSEEPTVFSEGLATTPSEDLKRRWSGTAGLYTEYATGYKQIGIELSLLQDPMDLVATVAHEVAHIKLLGEKRILENDEPLTDLTAVFFGYGIFMGNSVFKFTQWRGISQQGWSVRRKGYLPEQIIAFALALLAIYKNENTDWKKYLNKTMLTYFEQNMKYISKNQDKISFNYSPDDNIRHLFIK